MGIQLKNILITFIWLMCLWANFWPCGLKYLYPEYTKSFFEKRTEKQKINKQCPFLVTRDHFFAFLRARNNTKKCCLGHQLQTDTQHCVTLIILKCFFFYHGKFWNNKNSHLQMGFFLPSAMGTFFCRWAPSNNILSNLCQWVLKWQKNFHRKSHLQIIFFFLLKFCHNRKNKSYICFDRLESGKLIR